MATSLESYLDRLPASWAEWCQEQFCQDYFRQLWQFVCQERTEHSVFPAPEQVFSAFEQTPFTDTKVVILGQDPYHGDGQAHGMCFSVQRDTKIPPSLKNIYKELQEDLGIAFAEHGCLAAWAKQGVLLLNTVLTVRAHKANSHRKKGWETFTDAVIKRLSERVDPVVFVLWGKPAQEKSSLIDGARHRQIMSPHPSPLSARTGFFGSKPFSQINEQLEAWGQTPIDWQIK